MNEPRFNSHGEAMPDYENQLRQLRYFFQPSVSQSTFSVLQFIADRTWGQGEEWELLTAKDIALGMRDEDGVWLHCGTGLSTGSVLKQIHLLLNEGYLIRETTTRMGYPYFEYSLHWPTIAVTIVQNLSDIDRKAGYTKGDIL